MYTRQTKWVTLQVAGGFVALIAGITLIGVLNWDDSLFLPVNVALGLAGITLCSVGMRLFFVATNDIPPVEVNGVELGSLQLNGYLLVAYESETADGRKQFRLATSSPITPEKEAALIRYLILEGFLVSLWPEMKDRIEEEAGWAFRV